MHRSVRLTLLILIALAAVAPAASAAGPVVRGVTAPRAATAGARLALRVTVRPAGRTATLRAWLSTDRRHDRRDVALGRLRVPRRAHAARATLTVPGRVRPGSYRVIVCGKRCAASAPL